MTLYINKIKKKKTKKTQRVAKGTQLDNVARETTVQSSGWIAIKKNESAHEYDSGDKQKAGALKSLVIHSQKQLARGT